MMGLFLIIVLLSYLFNGADWIGVTYVVELLYLSAMTILIAGCPDRRLLPTIAELYSRADGASGSSISTSTASICGAGSSRAISNRMPGA